MPLTPTLALPPHLPPRPTLPWRSPQMINHKWGGSTTIRVADGCFSIVCEEELVPDEQVFIRFVVAHTNVD